MKKFIQSAPSINTADEGIVFGFDVEDYFEVIALRISWIKIFEKGVKYLLALFVKVELTQLLITYLCDI